MRPHAFKLTVGNAENSTIGWWTIVGAVQAAVGTCVLITDRPDERHDVVLSSHTAAQEGSLRIIALCNYGGRMLMVRRPIAALGTAIVG